MSTLAVPLVLAHAGHVLIDLSVFLGPVIAIAMWFGIASWRDRRSAARGDPPQDERRAGDGRA